MSMFNWKKDIEQQPIETILLFDERQLLYFEQHGYHNEFAMIFRTKPYIEWFVRNKVPKLNDWVDAVLEEYKDEPTPSPDIIRSMERDLICSMEDWVIYVTTPDDYNNQPFVNWDEKELTEMTNYSGKTVVDIGSGTGKQAFAVAPFAKYVYCVEPVSNLRRYLRERAVKEKRSNIFVVDGLIEKIPFQDEFADITMGGHVFGDMWETELGELNRVTKQGGMIILCPGNIDKDNACHEFLVNSGFEWSRFLEPGDTIGCGYKRKYWKRK